MLETEMRNEASTHLDKMDTLSMVTLINKENINAVKAIEAALPDIAKVCDIAAKRFSEGGRIFYIGAGTSGRLGIIDAAECPPTFGVSSERVVGIIAGGEKCVSHAGEGNEDSREDGIKDIKAHDICEKDVVIGISAAGGADYVVGALEYANSVGAYTVSISNNADTKIEKIAKSSIIARTGAEVLTGSTRMKAGTSQKIILNMISTSVMVKQGYVYENMMINLKPSNKKLHDRVIRIVCEIKKCGYDEAVTLLDKNDWDIRKVAEDDGKE